MTEDEKTAREWLERACDAQGPSGAPLRTLRALLDRPTLPPSFDEKTKELFVRAYKHHRGGFEESMGAALDALYAHLTKPKTKTVEVWRVEFTEHGRPACWTCLSVEEAHSHAITARNANKQCIRVTGPHTQEVPDPGRRGG